MNGPEEVGDDALSSEATTVVFNPVKPLVRVAVAADEVDVSGGSYVLAFNDHDTWHREWLNCERKIAEQCEAGARIGCSISATKKCRPSWWQSLLHFLGYKKSNIKDREVCEELELQACLAVAKERCIEFSKDTCKVFSDVRVALPNDPLNPRHGYRRFNRGKIESASSIQEMSLGKRADDDRMFLAETFHDSS